MKIEIMKNVLNLTNQDSNFKGKIYKIILQISIMMMIIIKIFNEQLNYYKVFGWDFILKGNLLEKIYSKINLSSRKIQKCIIIKFLILKNNKLIKPYFRIKFKLLLTNKIMKQKYKNCAKKLLKNWEKKTFLSLIKLDKIHVL